ncbi:MAG: lycopene cyclase family protein [Bacteriovoracaceae bacterium]
MDEKPVIIIGGGLWGTLLALRIRECLPHIPLKVYASGNQLGEKLAVSFHESDVSPESMKWLSPFISKKWEEFQVSFPRYSRTNSHRLCTMEPAHFHAVAREKLGANTVFLNQDITPEEAVREASFVIDTVSRGYFKAIGYQKTHGLVVKLLHPHRLTSPLTMDATVPQSFGFRYLQALPLSDETLLIKDVRFSSDPQLYHEDFEMETLRELHQRRWIIGDILERETEFRKIPREKEENLCEGRVIRLDGFVHDVTGDALPDAVRLIDRMVKTSFRLGELKSVMKQYLEERRSQRKILRLMNRMLYQAKTPCKERYQFFESLHSMPPSVREKFYKGDLEIVDVLRTLMNVRFIPRRKMPFLTLNKNTESVAIV